jgi:hypothetical protein
MNGWIWSQEQSSVLKIKDWTIKCQALQYASEVHQVLFVCIQNIGTINLLKYILMQ